MCDLLWWLLIARVCFVNHSGHMSSSKRVGGRKVNSDENNKAVAEPPAETANPLHVVGIF
ncbi:hypothetical protein T10_11495 [Trichinella papuae]|uniref:Uncharacterized protein n=1 Tax=Trichinella papuae TaxID=268474 RepID=A0A0V1MN98_9BILA|nr:hypothetical protein T10_11495 [Trichinella papuae]